MSDHAPPDALAFSELEQLVRGLGEELARFRRRALQAETQLRELTEGEGGSATPPSVRVAELEAENAALRARLDAGTARVRGVLERVRFLRQQGTAAGDA